MEPCQIFAGVQFVFYAGTGAAKHGHEVCVWDDSVGITFCMETTGHYCLTLCSYLEEQKKQ